jgi:hypothetical protein
MKDGESILCIRFGYLQLDSAEYMRMPARNAKRVLIRREALDARRFEAGAGEKILGLAVEHGDCDEFGHGFLPSCARRPGPRPGPTRS